MGTTGGESRGGDVLFVYPSVNINVTDSSPALYTSRYSCVVSTRWSQTVAVAPVVVVAGIVAAVALCLW